MLTVGEILPFLKEILESSLSRMHKHPSKEMILEILLHCPSLQLMKSKCLSSPNQSVEDVADTLNPPSGGKEADAVEANLKKATW